MSIHSKNHRNIFQQNRRQQVLVFTVFCSVVILLFTSVALLIRATPVAPPPGNGPTTIVPGPAQPTMTTVLIPIREIQKGELLLPGLFKTEEVAEVAVNDKMVRRYEDIRGKYARALIIPEVPLYASLVAEYKPVTILDIPEGYRAITIKVDEIKSVEGWLSPGAYIDVLWSHTTPGVGSSVDVLVSAVKVLSVERDINQNPDRARAIPATITLAVALGDAMQITLAEGQGSLRPILRGSPTLDESIPGPINKVGTMHPVDPPIEKSPPAAVNCTKNILTIDGKKHCLIDGRVVLSK